MDSAVVISNLEALVAQGKESAMLRYGLGNEYLKLGENWVAVYHLKRAVELEPDYSAAWKILGKALSECGVLHKALDAYHRGIAAAERRGDNQAAKEMTVFASRLEKQIGS